MAAAALAGGLLMASPAQATDFSFSGGFVQDDNVAFFDFVATGASTVTLRSYSYAGGTNAAGTTFGAGGFDPILTLYNLTTGLRIAFQDDGGLAVPVDPVIGQRYDVSFSSALAAGSYRVALTQYDNFGGLTLADPFQRAGEANFTSTFCRGVAVAPFCDFSGAQRTGAWAFDILGVDTATGPGPVVPEPATWAMMLVGFGMIGTAMRRRSIRVALAA
jgi:hypothetical protein